MKLLVFDAGGTELKSAVITDDLQIRDKQTVATPKDSFDQFAEVIRQRYQEVADQVEGIAMSLPGFVDRTSGRVNGGGALTYNIGQPVGSRLEAVCGCSVSVENDGKAAARAELAYGALQGTTNSALFIIGTGVGGGIIIDGRVVRGIHATAGEFSFLNTDFHDFSTYQSFVGFNCSTNGLLAMYNQSAPDPVKDGREFFRQVRQGNAQARQVLEAFSANVAKELYNLYWLLDLEKTAIGGGISNNPELVEEIDRQYRSLNDELALPANGQQLTMQIVNCRFHNDANLIGAYLAYQVRE